MATHPFYIVGIGSSAGGTAALSEFFRAVSPLENVAFVLIPHLRPGFRSRLDEIIQRQTAMPVIRVTENQQVLPGLIYLLTEDRVMTTSGGILHTRTRRADEVINCAINHFFSSLAIDLNKRAMGIILSGLGDDGMIGVQDISLHGGLVLAQAPWSAEFDSMPASVIRIDHPASILLPAELALQLQHYVRSR